MKTITCPRCFVKHEISSLAWGCAKSDCSMEAVPVTTTDLAPECAECKEKLAFRVCPDCGFLMNKVMDNYVNLPISIAGSESSGKSHYLTVLVDELRKSVGSVYNFSLMPIGGDDTMNQYNDNYYKPVFEEGTIIESTQQANIRPLIYSLAFDNNTLGKTSTFTFYDACGANFANERAMADYNRSLINSSGIILLIDPSQLPFIRNKYISSGVPVIEDDFSSLLSRTISLIREGIGSNNLNEKLEIPVAVCISKLDSIRDELDPSSFLQYPSRHLQQAEYDINDHQCCSNEVEEIIKFWGGADIINQLKSQFSTYAFFAFSSLGYPPKDKKILYISPHRVADPFLWLLAKNRVISSKKHVL